MTPSGNGRAAGSHGPPSAGLDPASQPDICPVMPPRLARLARGRSCASHTGMDAGVRAHVATRTSGWAGDVSVELPDPASQAGADPRSDRPAPA